MDWRHALVTRFPASLLLALALLGPSCKGKINSSSLSLLTTVRVSLPTTGSAAKEGDAEVIAERPDISDSGRYVVFSSKATNLGMAPVVTNNFTNVFLRDNVLRTTVMVSVNPLTGNPANGNSTQPSISGDGRFIVFASTASDLSPEDTDTIQDIFVRDLQDVTLPFTIQLVSRISGPNGIVFNPSNKANSNCNNPRISKSGRYVVFDTGATNLDPADSDSLKDIYRRDINDPLAAFVTTLCSRSTGTVPLPGPKGTVGNSQTPSVSRDGHLIAYRSTCPDMVIATADGGPKVSTNGDIFVHNVDTRRTIRVSLGIGPLDPDNSSSNPAISGDGNFVVYQSNANNLNVADDVTNVSDIFLRDISDVGPVYLTKKNEILSVHSSGAQAGAGCDRPAITEDGLIVVWDSPSTNLVNGDSNNVRDIFLRDKTLAAAQTLRVSVATFGGELNANSLFPAISPDGRYVVFQTQATNAADDDTNGAGDFYMRGPPF